MYYGLFAFSELVANYSRWLPLSAEPDGGAAVNFAAHASVDDQGGVRVLLLHKDLQRREPVNASVSLPAAMAPRGAVCSAARLQAPAPAQTAREGIRYAGLSFDRSVDGAPVGRRAEEPVSCELGGHGLEMRVAVAPLSAVIIRVSPD